MKKTLTILLMLVAVLWAAACTSSNTSTSVGSNSGYDSQYREQSRGNSNYPAGDQPNTVPGEPPVTLMMVGMETGELHPGEDYYVYAIVDNPDNKELEYEWSISNGEPAEVPEAERGRLATLVEDEKKTALAQAAPPAAPEAPAPAVEGAPAADGAVSPGAGTPVTGGDNAAAGGGLAGGASKPAAPSGGSGAPTGSAPPPGAALPGGNASGQGGSGDLFKPAADAGGSSPFATGGGGGGGATIGGGSASGGGSTNGGSTNSSTTGKQKQKSSVDNNEALKKLLPSERDQYLKLLEKSKNASLSKAEQARLNEYQRQMRSAVQSSSVLSPAGNGGLVEKRIVCGPEPAPQDLLADSPGVTDAKSSTMGLSGPAQSAVEAARAALAELGTSEPSSSGGNVADKSSPKYAEGDELKPADGSAADSPASGIRGEYQAWQGMDGAARRRPLGSTETEAEETPATADDSFSKYSFKTDDPYILWTPKTPGEVTIYVRAVYKEEVVSEVKELPVSVELLAPQLTVSDEFPDVVKEDDSVVVRILGENIPEFFKGLITITFDINALSFREAELGEFFDDASSAKLFEAQPDKTQGKVLFAIDSNTEISDLSGSNPVIYLKFKAKKDIEKQEDAALALVTDTSATYILDRDGDNILPAPVEHPAYKSEVSQPPAPAVETPAQPTEGTPGGVAQGATPAPGAAAPGAGGITGGGSNKQGGNDGLKTKGDDASGGDKLKAGSASGEAGEAGSQPGEPAKPEESKGASNGEQKPEEQKPEAGKEKAPASGGDQAGPSQNPTPPSEQIGPQPPKK